MADLKLPKINRIQISGRITKDLEMKTTSGGTAVLRFSIASDRMWKDKEEWKTETTFVNIQAWSGLAESINRQAHKGSAVLIEGRLSCNKYEKDGVQKEFWEIIADTCHVLEWLPKGDAATPDPAPPTNEDVPF